MLFDLNKKNKKKTLQEDLTNFYFSSFTLEVLI